MTLLKRYDHADDHTVLLAHDYVEVVATVPATTPSAVATPVATSDAATG